jgi:excisionase family DNA binding protein
MAGMEQTELLTPDEAASLCNVTGKTLLRWAREGRIECVRVSRKVIGFTKEAVDNYLRSRTIPVELEPANHQRAGRKTVSPETRKGGRKKRSGELWRDLRKEVLLCQ